ncbi:MmgE/PrpD family protein [uncultured Roseobacter sp.]|uniref:MmgE/PrpD family protein n=1 Tax=uncultured Roseobacter sp. TaxID=114847 RepID=UPI00261D2698|nr:MmgE/PrpD family protein [uncultured Roseobacter sp.]
MSITDRLLDLAQRRSDPEALEMMQLSLADWAACGIAGAEDTTFDGFRRAAGHNSSGVSTVFGGGTAAAPAAALINGTLSHALDYDDTHFAHIGHPSVAVVPAVLALTEQQEAGFADLADAALAGVEASVLVGQWLGRGHYQIGFHQTATAGAFGAAVGAARLVGLGQDETHMALGLCASMASGLKSQFGTMAKPLNAGLAARTGVEAVLWAQAGVTAASDGLAGPLGFAETHHGAADDAALPPADRPAQQILQISHKFHACCHGLHAMLEAIGTLNIGPQDVAAVDIFTHPRWMSVCNQPEPETGLAVKFSYAHTAAMALAGVSTADISGFTDATAQDPQLRALRRLVRVCEDADLSEMQSRVRITLADGGEKTAFFDLAAPISLSERRSRLMRKAVALIGARRADMLWSAVDRRDRRAFVQVIGD